MNYERLSQKAQNTLVRLISEKFICSIRLIENLTDEIYPKVGGHFRHNMDFANSFLNGLETGKIDYAKRERNQLIEQNRSVAIEQIVFLIHRLLNLKDEILTKEIKICSEIDESVWHVSSVMRELEFLHSHTVHHHAIVAEKLSNLGVKVSDDFGVAPSTLKFWKSSESTLQRANRERSATV